jgi:hypothetical protein
MATLGVQPFFIFWLYVKSGKMLNYIVNMASKLLPRTNLEKWPQEMIHFEVDILLSWQVIVVKLSNFPTQPTIDQTSMTLGLVFVCNKGRCFEFKGNCRNPSLGLVTKAKACEGVGQVGSPRVIFHAPGSEIECEGMNLHIPKWAPTLGVRVLVDSWIFIEQLQGSKTIGLKSFLYHWKALELIYLKWVCMTHLDT